MLLLPIEIDSAHDAFNSADLLSPRFTNAIEQELQQLNEWIPIAASALRTFYLDDGSGYWRRNYRALDDGGENPNEVKSDPDASDTERSKPKVTSLPPEQEGHTSTLRAFFATHEYARWLSEEIISRSETGRADFIATVRTLCEAAAEKGYIFDKDKWNDERDQKMFRDGHFLVAISLLDNVAQLAESAAASTLRKKDREDFHTKAKTMRRNIEANLDHAAHVANQCAENLRAWEGGRALPNDQIHEFITLYAVRGLDLFRIATGWRNDELEKRWNNGWQSGPDDRCSHLPLKTILYDKLRKHVSRTLGYHMAEMSSRFDPIELAFGISLLNRLEPHSQFDLTKSAINCIVKSQLDDGAWPHGQLVSYDSKEGHPYVPSCEVALALTHLMIRQVSRHDLRLCPLLLQALSRSFKHIQANYGEVDAFRGWSNDHARLPKYLESWVTAVVLTFLIHYRDLLLELQQQLILRRYLSDDAVRADRAPHDRGSTPTQSVWPDMSPSFRRLTRFDFKPLNEYWEPKNDESIVEAVRQQLIDPIVRDLTHRPSHACRSLILWGDPGTGKTQLMTSIARTLDWPLVTIAPPNFLRHGGLEGFETAADEIFHDLHRLRRVVVLFDECEDFFKKRLPEQQLESRTVGAFITSGMLPRLQNLREKTWVIFALATNSDLDALDDAVRRPGRFDASIQITHPTQEAQRKFVEKACKDDADNRRRQGILAALDSYHARSQDSFHPPVTFAILKELIAVLGSGGERDFSRAFEHLERLVFQSYPPPLRAAKLDVPSQRPDADASANEVSAGSGSTDSEPESERNASAKPLNGAASQIFKDVQSDQSGSENNERNSNG